MSPVADLQELVDGRGDTRVQSREGFYSSKARTLRMQQDLEFTLTPSLCFLKWFSHFSISELSGQTDRQTPMLYHGQTCAGNVRGCVRWEAGSPVTRPRPSTPRDWGRDRSSAAATESERGSRASACSRAWYSPSPGRSLQRTQRGWKTASALAQHPPLTALFTATLFTLLVAELFVLCPLASLVLVRVQVDGLIDGLCHLLLPALRYDQREVLVQLLVAV